MAYNEYFTEFGDEYDDFLSHVLARLRFEDRPNTSNRSRSVATVSNTNRVPAPSCSHRDGLAAGSNHLPSVKMNPKLLKLLYDGVPEVSDWHNRSEHIARATLVSLTTRDLDYFRAQNLVSSSSRSRRGTQFYRSITKIRRVENIFLLAQYLLKREQTPLDKHTLFHATKKTNVDSICKYNFNWRYFGKARGNKFGKGVSFARASTYASHFPSDFASKSMFIVRVNKTSAHVGSAITRIPQEPHDSTINGQGGVVVKYEDNEFYPDYVVDYV